MRKTVSRASPSERIRISGIEFDGLHRNDLSLWPTSRLNTSPIHYGLVRMVADRNRTPLRRSGVMRSRTGERVPPTAGAALQSPPLGMPGRIRQEQRASVVASAPAVER
jgi:hypothetical protein